MAQFQLWFAEYRKIGGATYNAVNLATVNTDGKPSARIVLLKEVDADGFVFYTNYRSRKGVELAANPNAALTFWWEALERQVRAEGTVEKVDAALSDAYFQSRPRLSRLGAIASEQSAVLADHADLEKKIAQLEKQFPDESIPRPAHWGGYRLRPHMIEFWQGRPNRLHERIRHRLHDGAWIQERLSP